MSESSKRVVNTLDRMKAMLSMERNADSAKGPSIDKTSEGEEMLKRDALNRCLWVFRWHAACPSVSSSTSKTPLGYPRALMAVSREEAVFARCMAILASACSSSLFDRRKLG